MTNWRSEWFEIDDAVYLNAAGQGPLPKAAARAALEAVEWKKFPHRVPDDLYFELPNRVRSSLARLLGGRSEDFSLTSGASSGLAAVASGIDWKPDDEVLLAQGDFPVHFTTFLPLQRAGKLRVKIAQPRGRFFEAGDFLEHIGPRTRLVSFSLVRFDDGARLDAAAVAAACRQAGARLLLDLAQCAGALPLQIDRLGADFITASGYKWLLGPYGTGFFWVRPERAAQMPERPFYWMAAEGAEKFDTLAGSQFRLAPGGRRWDAPETANFLNLNPWNASLELLLRAGVETIWQHCRRLVAELIERLPRDRFVLASPADAEARGPYVCIAARKREETPAIFERLRQAGVVISLREGALRVSPHLYNSERDIDRFLSVLVT